MHYDKTTGSNLKLMICPYQQSHQLAHHLSPLKTLHLDNEICHYERNTFLDPDSEEYNINTLSAGSSLQCKNDSNRGSHTLVYVWTSNEC